MTRFMHLLMRGAHMYDPRDAGYQYLSSQGQPMTWSTQAIREASRTGDYGRVVKLTRRRVGVSQKQLGQACGISQSAVSRMESRGSASYDMTHLARAATHLQIPLRLVGLAEHMAAQAANEEGQTWNGATFSPGRQ